MKQINKRSLRTQGLKSSFQIQTKKKRTHQNPSAMVNKQNIGPISDLQKTSLVLEEGVAQDQLIKQTGLCLV